MTDWMCSSPIVAHLSPFIKRHTMATCTFSWPPTTMEVTLASGTYTGSPSWPAQPLLRHLMAYPKLCLAVESYLCVYPTLIWECSKSVWFCLITLISWSHSFNQVTIVDIWIRRLVADTEFSQNFYIFSILMTCMIPLQEQAAYYGKCRINHSRKWTKIWMLADFLFLLWLLFILLTITSFCTNLISRFFIIWCTHIQGS